MNIFTQPDNWASRILKSAKAAQGVTDKKFTFEVSCVAAKGEDIDAMTDENLARECTYEEFTEACDWEPLAKELGYDEDFPLRKDWHVGYYCSVYQGRACYYLDHSRIEYIFTELKPSDCTCNRESGMLNRPSCPLHSPDSDHAEGHLSPEG